MSGIDLSFYKSGTKKLHNGLLEEAYKDFYSAQSIFGCAYCLFLKANAREAAILLNLIENSSPAVNWLLCLCDLIQDAEIKKHTPTYFQIRNFYENDMNLLIKYGNINYAKKIFYNTKYFLTYNKEIYKYTARVLIDNNSPKDAITYLKKSADIYYKDPEVHFMLAQAYELLKMYQKAKEEYIKSNETVDGYFPAIKRLKELTV